MNEVVRCAQLLPALSAASRDGREIVLIDIEPLDLADRAVRNWLHHNLAEDRILAAVANLGDWFGPRAGDQLASQVVEIVRSNGEYPSEPFSLRSAAGMAELERVVAELLVNAIRVVHAREELTVLGIS